MTQESVNYSDAPVPNLKLPRYDNVDIAMADQRTVANIVESDR